MRKETLLVICFLTLVLGTVAVIWSYALPAFKPLNLGHAKSAVVSVGAARQERALNPQELASLNQWIETHRRGWGPLAKTAPSSGDAVVSVVTDQGASYRMILFTGLSGADWDNTVIVQAGPDAPFRVHDFKSSVFAPLRQIAEQGNYQRSAPP
ncbi:hypothetical protein [Acidomonas methanolica]|uniref:hypothetical protein n=1 Tax=Acidomonas methanolica TaxID=437 RepID=UPI002119CD0B|nr:hypothetical protein [Acidomonas methanolica]MCQ9154778.1 hypothetical protein [Acidomonas methanolica]